LLCKKDKSIKLVINLDLLVFTKHNYQNKNMVVEVKLVQQIRRWMGGGVVEMVWDQSAMASGWILGEETVSIFEGNRR
jgi:hypothetical protein